MRVLILILVFSFSINAHAFTKHFNTEEEAREYAYKKHNKGCGCVTLIKGKKGYWLRSCK